MDKTWIVVFQPEGWPSSQFATMSIVDLFTAANATEAYAVLNEREPRMTASHGYGKYSLFSADKGDMNHFRGVKV